MRYLITGGAGFIGSHLADALVARGDQVLILDDMSTGRRENLEHLTGANAVDIVEGSILEPDLVNDCMRSVDACFHLAAAVGVKLIVERPLDSLLCNVRGIDTVLSSAAQVGRPLLFTSTSELYGKGGSSEPLVESADRVLGSPLQARWAYADAKAFGESLAYSYFREMGSEMVVARLFNTVGPRQSSAYGMVVPRLVRQALTGDSLTVYGNGTQTRCFVHVLDTVQALMMLADAEGSRGRVFNVGSDVEIPIVELARRIIERTGSSSEIRLVPYDEAYETGFEELGRRIPNTSALRELTGWTPARTVDDAIDDAITFARNLLETVDRAPSVA